ncbi:MBL fold metallo-hydrolase [Paraglaciecola sp. MB-3u-78]|jgi:glyoxylase-like metal-dependent hydrolase (beta-lactamase superfamily II)|uniref:MBL fold metallo-hydrolase n=1 Tax=Paraglaciecola sp. MB-3u-78 TaxID=2058332 RepID=UPI000C32931B|nr:MBL fold metallo-hydrolase [Paraglaciecola sp. MB-3u-78]PKG97503.1 MBL fold metallo-hydrolase [Paraglaciecola sp. MB-3u-78]
MNKIDITAFFHEDTNTISYLVVDVATSCCAIIDPVLDYDPASGRTSTLSADIIVSQIVKNGYTLEWILETHAHADHLSAAHYVKGVLGGSIGIGEHICRVQETFKPLFNLEKEFKTDGSQFDHLFADEEIIKLGHVNITVIHTPGHTPACVSYLIEDSVFVGDTLFMPDYGTARTDFPLGSAKVLYQSIQRILSLPALTTMFVGHDYKAPARDVFAWETSVIEQQRNNVHVKAGVTLEEFVKMREARDVTLNVPRLLLPAIQINIRAGAMPPKESNGHAYLKIPLNTL